jgi:hypothetical protein
MNVDDYYHTCAQRHVICRFTTGGWTGFGEIRSVPFRSALHIISHATGARSEDMGYTIQPALNRSTMWRLAVAQQPKMKIQTPEGDRPLAPNRSTIVVTCRLPATEKFIRFHSAALFTLCLRRPGREAKIWAKLSNRHSIVVLSWCLAVSQQPKMKMQTPEGDRLPVINPGKYYRICDRLCGGIRSYQWSFRPCGLLHPQLSPSPGN